MSIVELPLIIQTTYAELIEQLRLNSVTGFAAGSTFRKRTIAGRLYWYVQEPTGPGGRPAERYLGADTPERQADITKAQGSKADRDARKAIRRSLAAAGLPEPDPLTADIVDALADAGVFRLRGVIVGTIAYQAYAGHLGVRLPGATIRTSDLDIAQDYGVSVALDERLEKPFVDVLRSVDSGFRPVPVLAGPNLAATYTKPGGYRVDVLTTNRGAERDAPVNLPSLQTDAVPLRFLDYLLRDTIEAAILTRHGALVNVPSPERYAVHKLIVSVMRHSAGASAVKANKDAAQAGFLIEALIARRRKAELAEALHEAIGRGDGWKQRVEAGAKRLAPDPQTFIQSCF